MSKFEIFNEMVSEFMTDAASLFTEVFVAKEENAIAKDSYEACTKAYYTVQEACYAFEDNQICIDEVIEFFDQAVLLLYNVNDKFGNSARDLYITSRGQFAAVINA